MSALPLPALEIRVDAVAGVKLLGPGPPLPEPVDFTWKSVEGLTHAVFDMRVSVLTTRCMLSVLKKRNLPGYVYHARSSSYLPHELKARGEQPVTCLWCATYQRRP